MERWYFNVPQSLLVTCWFDSQINPLRSGAASSLDFYLLSFPDVPDYLVLGSFKKTSHLSHKATVALAQATARSPVQAPTVSAGN